MAQSRRRIFIVMVREDIWDETYAEQLSRVITDVLPHALYNEHGGPHYRETIQDLMKCNRSVLKVMGKHPTPPPICQDRVDHFCYSKTTCSFQGLLGAVKCDRIFSEVFGEGGIRSFRRPFWAFGEFSVSFRGVFGEFSETFLRCFKTYLWRETISNPQIMVSGSCQWPFYSKLGKKTGVAFQKPFRIGDPPQKSQKPRKSSRPWERRSGWAHTGASNLTVYHSQPLFLRSWIPVSEIPWTFTMLCFRWHGRKVVGWEGGGHGDRKWID